MCASTRGVQYPPLTGPNPRKWTRELRFPRREFVFGLALAVPVSYPRDPYYGLALVVLLVSLPRLRLRVGLLVRWLLFVGVTILAALVAGGGDFDLVRALYVSGSFVLFLFGYAIRNQRQLLDGFGLGAALLAVAVLVGFVVLRPFTAGLSFLYMPELRLWGLGVFPDWPNFLAFGLGLGALVNGLLRSAHFSSAICLAAALATTSRTALIAVLVLVLAKVARRRHLSVLGVAAVVGLGLTMMGAVAVTLANPVLADIDPQVVERLAKTSDRARIWISALEMIADDPWLGIGPAQLNFDTGIAATSIHNSFFDIAIRFGLPALVLWLAWVLRVPHVTRSGGNRAWIAVYFLTSALVQNILRHPHYMMLYAALVLHESPKTDPRGIHGLEQ